MICPKCGAYKMSRDKPVYFNKDNLEGDSLYFGEEYRCQTCGKVVFVEQNIEHPKKKFIRGQVITGGYEDL